jgi:hypothetical protein
LKKIYFSSHKLPKQQSISFWSQGISGVKVVKNWAYTLVGCFSADQGALGFGFYVVLSVK